MSNILRYSNEREWRLRNLTGKKKTQKRRELSQQLREELEQAEAEFEEAVGKIEAQREKKIRDLECAWDASKKYGLSEICEEGSYALSELQDKKHELDDERDADLAEIEAEFQTQRDALNQTLSLRKAEIADDM
jgi:hypothetical protein